VTVRHGVAPYGQVKLDDVDREIMRLLRHDGRAKYSAIAREVGVSEPTVRKRVDRLRERGAIYISARVNPAPIGFQVDAMIGIRAERGRTREVGDALTAMEHVSYVGYLTGSLDILIEVFLPDTERLFTFLNEDLNAIDGIAYTETWHVVRTEKFNYMWEGENVSRQESSERTARRGQSPQRRRRETRRTAVTGAGGGQGPGTKGAST
jgi:Lrp/AsnC family transcriptional regulator, regulator for asnA, asnC and gidA